MPVLQKHLQSWNFNLYKNFEIQLLTNFFDIFLKPEATNGIIAINCSGKQSLLNNNLIGRKFIKVSLQIECYPLAEDNLSINYTVNSPDDLADLNGESKELNLTLSPQM